eukprot:m.354523 g.354523  ORF g.354523 m.354523 type:complete len:68 (-) comp17039_c0_seq1:3001-3204(-)
MIPLCTEVELHVSHVLMAHFFFVAVLSLVLVLCSAFDRRKDGAGMVENDTGCTDHAVQPSHHVLVGG